MDKTQVEEFDYKLR